MADSPEEQMYRPTRLPRLSERLVAGFSWRRFGGSEGLRAWRRCSGRDSCIRIEFLSSEFRGPGLLQCVYGIGIPPDPRDAKRIFVHIGDIPRNSVLIVRTRPMIGSRSRPAVASQRPVVLTCWRRKTRDDQGLNLAERCPLPGNTASSTGRRPTKARSGCQYRNGAERTVT